jgi:hypothetical protein
MMKLAAKSTPASPFSASPLIVYSQCLSLHHPLCSLLQTRPHSTLALSTLYTRFYHHPDVYNSTSINTRHYLHQKLILHHNRLFCLKLHTMSASASRKRKSPEPDALNEAVTTPSNSPARKKAKITENQKQTLIDNLQLESASHFIP